MLPAHTQDPSTAVEEAAVDEKDEGGSQELPLPADPTLRGSAPLLPSMTSTAIPPPVCPIGCTLVGKVCRHPDGSLCLMTHPIDMAVQDV